MAVSDSDFATLSGRVSVLEANMNALQAIHDDTKELLQGFRDVQAGFRVLGWLGKASKPILWIIGAATAIVTLFKVGQGK